MALGGPPCTSFSAQVNTPEQASGRHKATLKPRARIERTFREPQHGVALGLGIRV